MTPAAIARFSKDGNTWSDGTAVTWARDDRVTKLVVGYLEDAGSTDQIEIPSDLGSVFPNLTHLYLWNIVALSELQALPSRLHTLDVRSCPNLRVLGAVPNTLSVLDVGGCRNLITLPVGAPFLTRFNFNDCLGITELALARFLEPLRTRQANSLVECDASGCPSVVSLDLFPRSLRKLRLARCPRMESADCVGEFTTLEHLDVSDCSRLSNLPTLPKSVRFLALHGCESLIRFGGQDLGPYDRGNQAHPNVAIAFHTRIVLGDELAVSARAKMLILGDGRAGKTTLVRRLQWDSLTPAEQAAPENASVRPRANEAFTHKVRFAQWNTRLQLEHASAVDINSRSSEIGLLPPCDEEGRIAGTVAIWDFGGQELYYHTHRLFAAEGSLFLIVWRADPIPVAQLEVERPSFVTDDEWNAWNRQRSLDYWIDYVRSIRPDAQIILVCTHSRTDAPRIPWTSRAVRYKSERIPCFYIDSLEDSCSVNPDYIQLLALLREHLGAEATRCGLVQPAFYARMSKYVDGLLADNEQRRAQDLRPRHLLATQASWREAVRHEFGANSSLVLSDDNVQSLTDYLHAAGTVFALSQRGDHGVLIDQDWATDLIYDILRPGGRIGRLIKANGGLFTDEALESDGNWSSLKTDLERSQLLAYLQDCGLIVQIVGDEQHRMGKRVFLATEKWLLPPYASVMDDIEREALSTARRDSSVVEHFSFDALLVDEFEFRDLMAHIGRIVGSRATWFRNGVQIVDDHRDPHWCLQLKWFSASTDAFLGSIVARLIAPRDSAEQLASYVDALLTGEESPLAGRVQPSRTVGTDRHGAFAAYFRDPHDSDFDVAVSSSGGDVDVVAALVDSLTSNGLRVAWYRLPECRSDENAKVMKFMTELRRPPCLLMFLSDSYLADDPANNWYCVWELADAILQIADGKRPVHRTLVVYRQQQALNSKNLNEVAVRVFRKMEDYFLQKYTDLPAGDRDAFSYYLDFSRHFHRAASGQAMERFFEERGTLGTYSRITTRPDGSKGFESVLQDIRVALGSR